MKSKRVRYKVQVGDPDKPQELIETFKLAIFLRWGNMPERLNLPPNENNYPMWTYISRTVAIIQDVETGQVLELIPEAIIFDK